jgi:hypothetical protein
MPIEDVASATHDQRLPPCRNEGAIGFDDQTPERVSFRPVRPEHLHKGILASS